MSRLRCDRALPVCDSCIKRGDVVSCSYVSRRPNARKHQAPSHGASDPVQNRIDRLENLVHAMMGNASGSGEPRLHTSARASKVTGSYRQCAGPANDYADESQELYTSTQPSKHLDERGSSRGMIRIDLDYKNPSYIGESHWATLLNEVGLHCRGVIVSQIQ